MAITLSNNKLFIAGSLLTISCLFTVHLLNDDKISRQGKQQHSYWSLKSLSLTDVSSDGVWSNDVLNLERFANYESYYAELGKGESWINDVSSDSQEGSTSCKDARLAPNGTLPMIALASFPGSGNTWSRYLLERATGLYTGSRYKDGKLFKGGFIGEFEDHRSGRTVAIKTHLFPVETDQYSGIILLIRNPYEAFLSEFNRRNAFANVHTGHASVEKFEGEDWTKFIFGCVVRWTNTITRALDKDPKLLVVYYEDLKSDMITNLKRMVSFLHQPLDEERLNCTKTDSDGKFHRKKLNMPLDPYTEEMVLRINGAIEKARDILRLHNKKPLPQYERKR